MILPLCIVALCPGPLAAEGQAPIALDLAALLALAERPWRSEDSFLDVLHEPVPNFAARRGGSRLPVPHNDPFLYNIYGHFAQPPTPPEGPPRSACARRVSGAVIWAMRQHRPTIWWGMAGARTRRCWSKALRSSLRRAINCSRSAPSF